MPRIYAAAPNVIETDLDDELIILDPGTQEMFSLNDTGRHVWRTLPATEQELVGAVLDGFEVTRAKAKADVRRLIAELLEARLVKVCAEDAGDG